MRNIVPVPQATINIKGKVILHNSVFSKIIYNKKEDKKKALCLFDLINEQRKEEFGQILKTIKVNESRSIEVCVTTNKLFYLIIITRSDKSGMSAILLMLCGIKN